ncbi:rhomboid family intramembrane serine protease [Clostridium aestuarii]|uniref:Rhomboid family intramembrane serine protease n=1 Tax=Clostridium aestuarii TaxID=338193 RepID=A0ABT4CZX7_9CLOT|nr:rhomboid family intramembrane serine protease [Clostridium aestuarii]MCY6484541.1 rhomboid family intramembrane serine protease [Clostridium aestuarii]
MKKNEFEKITIEIFNQYYNYNIGEFNSKSGKTSFWGITKELNNRRQNVVFLYLDNFNDMDISLYDEVIKIIVIDSKNPITDIEKIKETVEGERLIIVNKDNNELLYHSFGVEETVAQIQSVLNYREKLKEEKARAKKPVITISIIAINVVMYIITILLSGNILGSILESDIRVLIVLGAKVNELIAQGQYYRLITCAFLHGGLIHLLVNMYALYVLGPLVETVYGKIKYLVIYFSAALVSSVFSYLFSESVSIGASGAIFGLLGAILVFAFKRRDKVGKGMVKNVLSVIAMNVFIGVALPNIDNFGHLGGLVGGLLISGILLLV